MRISEIAAFMGKAFPLGLQEKYDNAGPQLLFGEDDAGAILLALDVDRDVLKEAIARDCNLIISHHPLLFRPLRNIVDSDPGAAIIMELFHNRVSVYSSHTNLDKVYHAALAKTLGYPEGQLLLESDKKSSEGPSGFGVLVRLEAQQKLRDVLKRVKLKLGLNHLRFCGNEEWDVGTLALLSGSGGSMLNEIIAHHRPDCVVTGDVRYHEMKNALELGIAVVDAGHFGTEKPYLPYLKKELEVLSLPVYISESEKDPFSFLA